MNWDEYVRDILRKPSCLDNIFLSLDFDKQVSVPPIIKASICILDQISEIKGIHNVIVFPERIYTALIFVILKIINDIETGKLGYCYDPYRFTKGQKLKLENCVMEFDAIEICDDGREKIFVKFAENLRYGLPIDMAPYFQITDTKRPLSKFQVFTKLFKSQNIQVNSCANMINFLLNYKTHIKSTVFYVTSVTGTKELIKSIKINDRNIEDLLLIGQVDYTGVIRNAGTGQLAGIPAITLSPDLYSVIEAIKRGIAVQSIVIDTTENIITQLDALDQLCRRKYPIVCVTDMIGSLNLGVLEVRDFNIWRWNEESITKDMFSFSNTILDKKLLNCANTVIEYCTSKCAEICDSLQLLYKHREDVRLQSPVIISIYGILFGYALTALRSIAPLDFDKIQSIRNNLSECFDLLEVEKKYISSELYNSLYIIIENLKKVYSIDYKLPKIEILYSKLLTGHYNKISIIISDKDNKNEVYTYWESIFEEYDINTDIEILYPNEFINNNSIQSDISILAGWFNRKIMQKILFSYNTNYYFILLYEYENRWKNAHEKLWLNACNREGNKEIVEKVLGKRVHYITNNRCNQTKHDTTYINDIEDELEEIDLILREHKYRKYISNQVVNSIEALPICFAGGSFAFFTPTHKLITVTDIIVNGAKRIAIKFANELNIGDFIVIRETQKDLIREVADIILSVSGKKQYRQKAAKWRDALLIEGIFYEFDDIYEKLKSSGCTKDRLTVRRWVTDEDVIIPQDKSDLIAIAMALDDITLLNEVDEIYEAGRTVMSAHIKAGRVISEKLRRCIADKLYSQQRIDPYSICNPITFSIDDVGKVIILKVIDITNVPVVIETSNANKLFGF